MRINDNSHSNVIKAFEYSQKAFPYNYSLKNKEGIDTWYYTIIPLYRDSQQVTLISKKAKNNIDIYIYSHDIVRHINSRKDNQAINIPKSIQPPYLLVIKESKMTPPLIENPDLVVNLSFSLIYILPLFYIYKKRKVFNYHLSIIASLICLTTFLLISVEMEIIKTLNSSYVYHFVLLTFYSLFYFVFKKLNKTIKIDLRIFNSTLKQDDYKRVIIENNSILHHYKNTPIGTKKGEPK